MPRTFDNAPPLFASELVAPNLATTDPLGELLLLFPYVERTNAWRSTAALPLQPVIESCVQSKVAISTMPPPTDDSTSSGTLPSASHTVLPAATTPVAISSRPGPKAPDGVRTRDPVSRIGRSAGGRPPTVLCQEPPVPSRSAPPCIT